ncbi:hypothetical protein [Modestobacter marinus]|uniref:hypothetical protein n=1 Tax=Modestobacter marinus TaxID=477641 RepID=UPI001C97994D|nr:hypothetical protein [Modestobacter marinus]
MRLPITLSEIAPRVAAGAFILNSGLGKRNADEATAAGLHGFATGAYPFLAKVPPATFAKALSTAEIVVGAALLTPLVPTAVAGAALTGFSAGLVGLYLRTPGMTKPGASIAPTQEGLTVSKDVWLLGIGLALVTRGLFDRPDRETPRRRAGRAAHKASAKSAKKLAAADRKAHKASAKAGFTAGAVTTRARDLSHR